tara:strand:+ start:96 stop:371 length:276 start_codon:yes stop_codon:yes gene_type:complete
MTDYINLNTVTKEALKAILDLDKTYIGTPHYLGVTYFWPYEFRHYLRGASVSQRKRVHKKWLAAGLSFEEVTQQHWDIIADVMNEKAPTPE